VNDEELEYRVLKRVSQFMVEEIIMTEEKQVNILSLGAGVQSSVLALMSEEGELPFKFDYAIFADTGWEPPAVMEYLAWIESRVSFPVYRVSKGSILGDTIAFYSFGQGKDPFIPYFDGGGAPGKRQCTSDYKIAPIQKFIRAELGFKAKQPIKGIRANMHIGISTDEVGRCKPSRVKWLWNTWPLIDKRMSRQDCLDWAAAHDFPEPPRSSCIGCPYHSEQEWSNMKRDFPEQFEQACLVDDIIRTPPDPKKEGTQYTVRQLVPLRERDFAPRKSEANHFNNECEGLCGV